MQAQDYQGWLTQSSGTTKSLRGVSFTDSDNGTVVGQDGTIIRTTNGGTTWISQSSGTTEWLYGVSFTDSDNGTIVGGHGLILRTTDGGTTWEVQRSSSIYRSDLGGVSFTDSTNGTTAGGMETILKTTDGGTTWVSQSSGTTETLWGVSFTDSDNGTIVGDAGTILRTTNGGIVSVEMKDKVPTEYLLSQNYPNPFNTITTINYAVKEKAFIQLKVTDVLGNEVATLVNEEKQPGNYSVSFYKNNLPGGVYVYSLQVNNFLQIRKMILLK